ncbi:glycosyltransferase [Poseidonocella sedimentorum]|uniref:Glycosyltransferase like family 2 n=1 Tax=Poseidonocella sedimentorum TaxID=871652 RepID=A0A1I6EIR9_9RHOB|nr:glycosyltransferase family 2 protein [Poseidonocella sedimentorum]SFR17408.1 Glycosyltransferase like family 2 [Poseidonocella sedimentorum]
MAEQLKLGVGAITRRRPVMFAEMLESFEAMALPEGIEVVFLFAENDAALSMQEIVDEFAGRTGYSAKLELETRPGIPMARNRVLDMALAEGCDFLTFVDDDELVRSDWLVELFGGLQARGLDLAGGPVHYTAAKGELGFWNKACLEYLLERGKKRNRRRARMAVEGTDWKFPVYTNNWCARLSTVSALGIRFNEALQFTGGSDTRFSLDMAAAGGKVGWIPSAIVEEPTPQSRLRISYQFARARDQAANSVRLRKVPLGRVVPYAISRYLDAVVNVIAAPIKGRKYLVKAVYKAGIGTGRLKGYFGKESQHYAPGTEKVHTEN